MALKQKRQNEIAALGNRATDGVGTVLSTPTSSTSQAATSNESNLTVSPKKTTITVNESSSSSPTTTTSKPTTSTHHHEHHQQQHHETTTTTTQHHDNNDTSSSHHPIIVKKPNTNLSILKQLEATDEENLSVSDLKQRKKAEQDAKMALLMEQTNKIKAREEKQKQNAAVPASNNN